MHVSEHTFPDRALGFEPQDPSCESCEQRAGFKLAHLSLPWVFCLGEDMLSPKRAGGGSWVNIMGRECGC